MRTCSIMKFLLALLISAPVFGATTGTLLLKGIVPRLLSLTVSPTATASNLPLDVSQTNTSVGTITESSNALLGYKVAVSSANLGKLVHDSVTTSVINYTLRYNGQSVNLTSGSQFNELTRGVKTRAVDISYTGIAHDLLVEGNYTDVVTFTMTAN